MTRRFSLGLLGCGLFLALWAGQSTPAHAQSNTPLNRYYYYPYYYFPHNYWPSMSAPWPNPSAPLTQPAPAYMAYPPFREPHWRFEMWEPQYYHRGFHFWLDQL